MNIMKNVYLQISLKVKSNFAINYFFLYIYQKTSKKKPDCEIIRLKNSFSQKLLVVCTKVGSKNLARSNPEKARHTNIRPDSVQD